LRGIADDLGSGAAWWEADVRDASALRTAFDECAATMGGIDFVVANAGVASYGTVRQADEASFERVLDINLTGVFRTLKYATPHLERSGGHVLVVASALSFAPLAALASYGASKAGVEMLALAYRQEVAHLGVTVGVVHPVLDRHRSGPQCRCGPALVRGPAQGPSVSGQRHHQRRSGCGGDRRRTGSPASPRVRPACGRGGQLGEGRIELAAGMAVDAALRGQGGSDARA
jgi:NAD(P)-dependent dehydrogenase (short-subunit alcohol dehydrogenase family)